MTRYKVIFSLANLVGGSQAEVVKLQQLVKTVMASLTGCTYLASNADYAMIVGAIGMLIDLVIGCLYFEPVLPAKVESPTFTEGGRQ